MRAGGARKQCRAMHTRSTGTGHTNPVRRGRGGRKLDGKSGGVGKVVFTIAARVGDRGAKQPTHGPDMAASDTALRDRRVPGSKRVCRAVPRLSPLLG